MTIEYLNNYLTKNKDLKDRSNFPKCWGPFVVDICGRNVLKQGEMPA